MAHVWKNYVTHVSETWHICEGILSNIWMSHGTHVGDSSHTYAREKEPCSKETFTTLTILVRLLIWSRLFTLQKRAIWDIALLICAYTSTADVKPCAFQKKWRGKKGGKRSYLVGQKSHSGNGSFGFRVYLYRRCRAVHMKAGPAKWREWRTKRREGHTKWREWHTKWREWHTKRREAHTKWREGHTKWREWHTKRREAQTKWREWHAKRREAQTKWQEGIWRRECHLVCQKRHVNFVSLQVQSRRAS